MTSNGRKKGGKEGKERGGKGNVKEEKEGELNGSETVELRTFHPLIYGRVEITYIFIRCVLIKTRIWWRIVFWKSNITT